MAPEHRRLYDQHLEGMRRTIPRASGWPSRSTPSRPRSSGRSRPRARRRAMSSASTPTRTPSTSCRCSSARRYFASTWDQQPHRSRLLPGRERGGSRCVCVDRAAGRGLLGRAARSGGGGPRGRAGAVVYRLVGETVNLLQVAALDDASAARGLLAAADGAAELRLLNAPEDDPASVALRALGGCQPARQHEMRRGFADRSDRS